MTNLSAIVNTIETHAPSSLAFSNDPIGMQLGVTNTNKLENKKIRKCIVSLAPSKQAVVKCSQINADLLITHYPLLQFPIHKITDHLYYKLKLLLKENIFCFTVHTNLDCAENGINDTLAEIMGFKVVDIFEVNGIPFGRILKPPKEIILDQLLTLLLKRINAEKIKFVGNIDNPVSKILLVSENFGRSTIKWIKRASQRGVDTFLTGDLPQNIARYALEIGMKLICVQSYYLETPGFRRFSKILSLEFTDTEFIFFDSGKLWKLYPL